MEQSRIRSVWKRVGFKITALTSKTPGGLARPNSSSIYTEGDTLYYAEDDLSYNAVLVGHRRTYYKKRMNYLVYSEYLRNGCHNKPRHAISFVGR